MKQHPKAQIQNQLSASSKTSGVLHKRKPSTQPQKQPLPITGANSGFTEFAPSEAPAGLRL